ncbi:MAG TPA: PrgI family protein [Candidatus Saccharimonadales bacterium]|nr:PrgI family protein [Candidatus Saccharimonadales bacterium]
MEQHPVPQHIASFEFKLFGNLTVRQFVTLAIPMSIAVAIFFSPLVSLVRIPLAIIVGGFAVFAALVPIGGRPFDKWVVAFIKAVLSPTQRVWVKEPKLPQFLNIVISAVKTQDDATSQNITVQGRERLKNYLRSLPKGQEAPLDVKEQIAVSRLGLSSFVASSGQTIEPVSTPPIIWPTTTTPVSKPNFKSSSQKREDYRGKIMESLPAVEVKHEQAAPVIVQSSKPFALPGLERKLEKEPVLDIAPVKTQLASDSNFTIESVIPIKTAGESLRLIRGVGQTRVRKLHFAPPEGFDLSKLPIRGERRFEISEELKRRFSKTDNLWSGSKPVVAPERVNTAPVATPKASSVGTAHGNVHLASRQKVNAEGVSLRPKEVEETSALISSASGQVPKSPVATATAAQMVPITNTPNIISGLVCDSLGSPLEKIIMVIRDAQGIPVRALKTNKLGQFLSATPLSDGKYTIELESQDFAFKPYEITVSGKTIDPILIKSEGVKS